MEIKNNITGNVRGFSDDVEETRTITFIASTDSKDRHGTVLNMDNWDLKNFNNNPIIGYQHNVYGGGMCDAPNPDDQLGVGKAYFSETTKGLTNKKELLVDITFEPAEINPLAEKIFRKVLHGSLRAVSVGFIPLKDAKGGQGGYGRKASDGSITDKETFFYHGQELLEISIVNIPSNPDALKKSFRESTSSALIYLNKALGKSFSEIEEMKVRDILNIIDNKKDEPIIEEITEKKEFSNVNCNEKTLFLLKLKGNSIK